MYKNVDYAIERDNMRKKYGCDTMCTAKFFTSTIYLQSGQTHSCYHPQPHQIPLNELKDNPSALHNTKHKIERRRQMLMGEKPEECNYCWRVEAIENELVISDRIIKSKNELLLTPDAHEKILENGWDHNYRPTYLEISFGNECNMRCAYCHPKASSAWMKEMDLHGPFENAEHLQVLHEKIYPEDDNPYVEAFWEWWPYLRKTLKVLRITGGEPLLQQNFWKFLEKLKKTDECKNMVVQVNTNFNVKPKLTKRFVETMNQILNENRIMKFSIYTSVESWGERATYTRNGLDLDNFEQNLHIVMKGLASHGAKVFTGVTIMNTFNIMCVTSYIEFLKKVLEWRKELHNGQDWPKVLFDIPHCTEPNHWTLAGLPDRYDEYFGITTAFMDAHRWKNNWQNYPKDFHDHAYFNYFTDEEFAAWNRVVAVWEDIKKQRASLNPDHHLQPRQVDDARRNWILFIDATDKRRKTRFKAIFPEMADYYDLCSTMRNIEDIEYNGGIKKELMSTGVVEFHWDDDFVWHYPALAQTLINHRKANNLPTIMFDKDKEVARFGDNWQIKGE